MQQIVSAFLIIGTAAIFPASATAQELDIRVPLPPVPKFVVPKPPARKNQIQPDMNQPSVPQYPRSGAPRDDGGVSSKGGHRYDYFPEAQVYFDPARQLYFFRQANRWAAKATLPPEINVRIGPRVTVELDSERPYEFHDEVRRGNLYREESRHKDRYDEGFEEGYQQGYNEGYNEGYNAGYKASFELGYREGYRVRPHDYYRDDKRGYDPGRR